MWHWSTLSVSCEPVLSGGSCCDKSGYKIITVGDRHVWKKWSSRYSLVEANHATKCSCLDCTHTNRAEKFPDPIADTEWRPEWVWTGKGDSDFLMAGQLQMSALKNEYFRKWNPTSICPETEALQQYDDNKYWTNQGSKTSRNQK